MTCSPGPIIGLLLASLAIAPPAAARAEVLGRATSVALGGGPVRVNLGRGADVAARVRALPSGRKFYLVVHGLHADAAPGVLYDLFLDLDATGPLPAAGDATSVGTINFYAAVPPNDRAPTVSFDITKQVRALAARPEPLRDVSVTLAPAEPPAAEARAFLGSVELVAE